jgi:hypothetical protein
MAEMAEWSLQVNIGTQGPVDVMMEDPCEGPHAVEILDVRMVTKEGEGGKTSLRFSVADVEPGSPTLGVQTMVVVGTDFAKPFNLGHLVNALLSIGCAPEKIKGTITVHPGVFRGRRGYIYVKAAAQGEIDDAGRPLRANKNFVTPAMYEAAKKMAAMKGASGAGLGLAPQVQAQRPAVQAPAIQAQTPAAVVQPMPIITQPTITPPLAAVAQAASATATAAEIGNLFSN